MSDHARHWWTHWLTCPACRSYAEKVDLCYDGLFLYTEYQWEVEDRALGAADVERP